jgi:inner membrane protein
MDLERDATRTSRLRGGVSLRLLVPASLVLLLQIPIALISGTIAERRTTRDAAFAEVSRTWGGPQQLAGPIVLVPAVERFPTGAETIVLRRFLPRTLSVRGRVDTEVRRRGIFDVPLYVARLHFEGTFEVPGTIRAGNLQWERASVAFGVSDPKALRAVSPLAFADRSVSWEPGTVDAPSLEGGVHAAQPFSGAPSGPMPFAFDLTLAGSGRLAVVPAGDETVVTLGSGWRNPSFDGGSLPVERRVGASGFEATWKSTSLGRGFPGSWTDPKEATRERLSASAMGVSFLSPVDTYRTNERAVKYQLLFLGLTFFAFVLFELLAPLRIHPMQYLLVGFALCLFYLLLLSFSEHLGFARAYAIAAADVVVLVTVYVRYVLGKGSRALALGAFLGALYAFLFVLLQIQDYALLVGSVGLFLLLAGVMWFTRHIDWYALGPPTPARPSTSAERSELSSLGSPK